MLTRLTVGTVLQRKSDGLFLTITRIYMDNASGEFSTVFEINGQSECNATTLIALIQDNRLTVQHVF